MSVSHPTPLPCSPQWTERCPLLQAIYTCTMLHHPAYTQTITTTLPNPALPVFHLPLSPPAFQASTTNQSNFHNLDGASNPDRSDTSPPNPSRLNHDYCSSKCTRFYVITVGWEVGIFDNWYVIELIGFDISFLMSCSGAS